MRIVALSSILLLTALVIRAHLHTARGTSERQVMGTDQTSNLSPLPRDGIAMAYEPARRCVVLFGGVNHLLKQSTRYKDSLGRSMRADVSD